MSDAKHVYKAIVAVTAAMAREGIGKGRRNEQQGYQFRGIDDIYNALSSVLAENNLCMLPRVLSRTATERATRTGGVSTYTIVEMAIDLVSAVDGSSHTIQTVGEAMDSADKSSNKAQSAAMKYACLMAFQIPTEGDNDADAHHPQKARPSTASSARGGQYRSSTESSTRASAPTSADVSDDSWVEWSLPHVQRMKDAQSAGELKAAFSDAWREADYRRAPPHIRASLEKAKDDLKGRFEGRAA